ncbi:hypothetical protein HID58_046576 [Brassica napus]|uniref:FBD domain-containing protein n=1 Tax=Brassica napus TaxID=3708 RepID=A0ABQ8AXV6_BRANA|nr:hypothetical protein HID58_046576 [Brassica napus]
MICNVLSRLPTKDAVKTIVWRSLWLESPCWELSSLDFPDLSSFRSFGDRVFDPTRVSCIRKLKLAIGEKDASYLTPWFSASDRRKIQHLHVKCCAHEHIPVLPISMYVFESLVCLKLYLLALVDSEFFALPCLKKMRLKAILYPNEATFERLVSSCPVLEELEIDECLNDDALIFRVLSTSLKKLSIDIHLLMDGTESGVEIDAPQLSALRISDILSETFLVKEIHPNAKVTISLTFGLEDFDVASVLSKESSISNFLQGVSKVVDMTICSDTYKLICQYSKFKRLPRFGYMSRLNISLTVSGLKRLTKFLESFPILKTLILVCEGDYDYMNEESLSSVPECLTLSLEFVYLEVPIEGHPGEMKLVRYFLQNSAILKKLTLHSVREKSTLIELRRIRRGSTQCELEVLQTN